MRSSSTASSVLAGCCKCCRTAQHRLQPTCFVLTTDNKDEDAPRTPYHSLGRSRIPYFHRTSRRSLHISPRRQDNGLQYWQPANLSSHLALTSHGQALKNNTVWETTKDFTFKDFEREAYVLAPSKKSTRLVDDPNHHEDFDLWAGLLDFRLRVDGTVGALEIWKGMHQRRVDLPTVGKAADRLWEIFVSIALENKRFLMELWDYAQSLAERTKRRWDALYERILGFFLRSGNSEASKAWIWHLRFKKIDLPGPGGVERLVEDALCTKRSLRVFKRIYDDAGQRDVYDKMITSLCERHEFHEAELWHQSFMKKGDLPSSAKIVEPLRAHLALLGDKEKLSLMTEEMVDAGVSYAETLPPMKANVQISREKMSEILGDTYGFKPKTISDSFASRWFATKTFSLQFIILGMGALGTESIGPLAMRELAARCESAADLKDRIKLLEKNNIKRFEGRYAEALRKVALENREDLYQTIISSDQHPEVYDDLPLQRKLLAHYMRQQDRARAESTLFVLGLFDQDADIGRWNRILDSHITDEDRENTIATLEDMLHLRIPVSPDIIKHSFRTFMPHRVEGKAPQVEHQSYDGLSFVTNMWLRIIQSGGEVPPTMWKQVIIGFGMLGRLKELETLTIWLASHYSKQLETTASATTIDTSGQSVSTVETTDITSEEEASSSLPSSSVGAGKYVASEDERHPMNVIFPTLRKRAIVEWGFLTLGKPIPKSSRALGFSPELIAQTAPQLELTTNGLNSSPLDTPTNSSLVSTDTFSALEDLPALDIPAYVDSSNLNTSPNDSADKDAPFNLSIPPFTPPLTPPRTHPHLDHTVHSATFDHPLIPRFTRGLALLRHLHALGVPVRVNSIRAACQHRLRELFEHDSQMQSNVAVNRIARAKNDLTLSQVVRACNAVWGHAGGRQLFRVKEDALAEIDMVEMAISGRSGKARLREGWKERRGQVWRECLGEEAAVRMEKVWRVDPWVETYRGSRKKVEGSDSKPMERDLTASKTLVGVGVPR